MERPTRRPDIRAAVIGKARVDMHRKMLNMANTEEPDEVNRVGGLPRLVKDPVGPNLARQQPDLVEGGSHSAVAELWR
ncbi:hypothetical protein ACFRCI_18570 [Streptomyces sp. NPDC056638]|uniref:hypothetical protein n=1 Tax=Streptomyces sp. NPDC056638 TaxID=3345887 RepID=UPI00368B2638